LRAIALACGLVASIAASVCSADPAAVDLWNGAAAGMNIDQVAALFPQAAAATNQTLEDGSQSGLSIPAQLGGSPADAIFFFHYNKLTAVLVESRGVRSAERAANLAEARRIVAAAASQYGPPKRCDERPELAALACVWSVGQLAVAVAYHDFGGGSPALSARYSRTR
jgi:hypothetical protein